MALPSIRWLRRIAIALAVVVPIVWAIWRLWTRLAPPLDAQMVLAVAIMALALLGGIWWLWWRLPRRQLHKLDVQIHDPKARADTEHQPCAKRLRDCRRWLRSSRPGVQ